MSPEMKAKWRTGLQNADTRAILHELLRAFGYLGANAPLREAGLIIRNRIDELGDKEVFPKLILEMVQQELLTSPKKGIEDHHD